VYYYYDKLLHTLQVTVIVGLPCLLSGRRGIVLVDYFTTLADQEGRPLGDACTTWVPPVVTSHNHKSFLEVMSSIRMALSLVLRARPRGSLLRSSGGSFQVGGRRIDGQKSQFSSLVGGSGASTLTLDALIGISDTVLMYLVHARPGMELDQLSRDRSIPTLGVKWRKMTEVLGRLFSIRCLKSKTNIYILCTASSWLIETLLPVKTQLHVISPFGFTPDPAGMQNFAQEMTRVMSQVSPSRDGQAVQDLQTANKDIWGVLVKRTFALPELKWLEVGVARSLAMGISSNLTNPTTLSKAEGISNRKDLSPEKKLDAIHDEILTPAYKSAMALMGMDTSDSSFAMANASIQVMGGTDPVVAQTMQMGLGALISKVPLLRGEM